MATIVVIAVFLIGTLVVGSGVGAISQSSSLDQFQTDSEAADKQAYIDEHFGGDGNTTTAQLIVRGENTLSKESLLSTLELQREFRGNGTIDGTLAEEPFGDLSNVVATTAIRQERADDLEDRSEDLEARGEALDDRSQRLEAEGEELAARGEAIEADGAELEADAAALEGRQATLDEDRAAIEARGEFMAGTLNETRDLRIAVDTGEITEAEYEAGIADLDTEARERLPDGEYDAFSPLIDDVAGAQADLNALDARYRAGEITDAEYETRSVEPASEIEAAYDAIENEVLAPASSDLAERGEALESDADELADRRDRLAERADRVEEDREALEQRGDELEAEGEALEDESEALEDDFAAISEIDPSTDERIAQLESMSRSEVDDVLGTVLSEDAPREVFVFLPTDYEPGSTSADARAIYVTQTTGEDTVIEGEAPPSLVDSQLAMADVVEERFGSSGFVFGSGITSDEIERSLTDSLGIVLPLALGFVGVVLVIAYRDPLDIVLGGGGILVVLLWTFGFMGWAGIAFNQIMIAVPVLLIGLSIDYAIHVFMRHREQRETQRVSDSERGATTREQRAESDGGTRQTMAVVLSGLGMALVWVTATAVIGFLSNLVSPVGPIREFGVASAVGIVSALLVFGLLIPAAKVELDAALESRGYDRKKRAFGTGGGPASEFLSLGGRVARRAPWAVIVVVLLLTAGSAYGA
ncbi:MAG: MMPL family transporter, partial [Halalkalicoccus sp.]|nr:MMPL family transporter [Halalkalicoccus sp.]